MIANAVYEGDKCLINTDFVIDAFENTDGTYTLYTIDNERRGYIVEHEVVDKWKQEGAVG